MNRLSPLLFFSICSVIDFVWGFVKWHLVGAGFVAIIGGLPSKFTRLIFCGSITLPHLHVVFREAKTFS